MNQLRDTLVIFGVGCAVLVYAFPKIRARYRAQKWQQSTGTLLSSSIENTGTSDDATPTVVAEYKYTVLGREFLGHRVSFDYTSHRTRGAVQAHLRQIGRAHV